MDPLLIIKVIQMVLAAEPAVVGAIHNLISGTGTADDITILKADSLVWQSIANKAAAEIAKFGPVPSAAPTAVLEMPSPVEAPAQ